MEFDKTYRRSKKHEHDNLALKKLISSIIKALLSSSLLLLILAFVELRYIFLNEYMNIILMIIINICIIYNSYSLGKNISGNGIVWGGILGIGSILIMGGVSYFYLNRMYIDQKFFILIVSGLLIGALGGFLGAKNSKKVKRL